MIKLDDIKFKLTTSVGYAIYGRGTYPLPKGDKPGYWRRKITGRLQPCHVGYHVTDWEHLSGWLSEGSNNRIFIAEVRGDFVNDMDKSCHQQIRLLKELEGRPPTYTDTLRMSQEQLRTEYIKWLSANGIEAE